MHNVRTWFTSVVVVFAMSSRADQYRVVNVTTLYNVVLFDAQSVLLPIKCRKSVEIVQARSGVIRTEDQNFINIPKT